MNVQWQSRKVDENKLRWYQCQDSWFVFSRFSPNSIEFELMRHDYRGGGGKSLKTVTAWFRNAPIGHLAEAWRILNHITRGKQLFPQLVENFYKRHVANVAEEESSMGVVTRSCRPGFASLSVCSEAESIKLSKVLPSGRKMGVPSWLKVIYRRHQSRGEW